MSIIEHLPGVRKTGRVKLPEGFCWYRYSGGTAQNMKMALPLTTPVWADPRLFISRRPCGRHELAAGRTQITEERLRVLY